MKKLSQKQLAKMFLDYSGVDLTKANPPKDSLFKADLTEGDLTKAKLTKANIHETSLTELISAMENDQEKN